MYVLSQLFVPAFVALFLPAGRERGLQSICFLACSRRSDSGVQCKVREREKNSRNLRLEVIGWNSGYANTRFHTKLNVRNSLLSHLARFLHFFFISLKANLIKTTAFMTFLGESINILNHRVQKIGQKSCTKNKNFEPKGPETPESSLGLAGDRVICYRFMGGGRVLVAVKSDLNPTHCLILDITLSGEHRGENIIERPRALFGVTVTRQASSAITLQWHVRSCTLNTLIPFKRKPRCKVYLFNKGDYDFLRSELQELQQPFFLSTSEDTNIEEDWELFKSAL